MYPTQILYVSNYYFNFKMKKNTEDVTLKKKDVMYKHLVLDMINI